MSAVMVYSSIDSLHSTNILSDSLLYAHVRSVCGAILKGIIHMQ